MKKGKASKRAMEELFSEAPVIRTASVADTSEAVRRDKLRREMLGDVPPADGASGSVRRETKAAMKPDSSPSPKMNTGTIPRVQTGTIPRVHTGTIPRVQTGKFQKVEGAPKPADDNAKTRKFNAVSVSEEKEKAKKKNRPTKKILIAVLSLLLIGGLTAAALIIFRRPPEEVKIVPTDVVAGVNETSDNVVEADLEAAYSAGEARHTVRFTFYEKPDFICTTADIKAGDLMRQLGIEYEKDKIVSLMADDSITSDVSIEIKDVTYDYDYETEAVANETVYVDDPSSYQGTETVAVEGYTGVKTYTYKLTLVNGTESERELVSEEITTAPQNRVINRGTKVIPTTPHSTDGTPTTIYTGVPENYLYYVDVRATCYYIVGTTATGLPTGDNVMAVDPNVIPLGSECVVIGEYGDYGHRIAADVGGGIKGNIIDIWLPAGTGFGWQNARVYVLREGF